MKLSVVVPVFNEQATIAETIRRVQAVGLPNEIIVVNDGSTDDTEKILSSFSSKQIRLISHKSNLGKGAALRSGIPLATGDIVIIQDADLEYDPSDYNKLIQPIIDNKADVVFGSRFVTGEHRRVLFFWHMLGNKFLTFLSNMLSNLNLTDMETGYKAFRREVIQSIHINENRFGIEPEITAKLARMNLRIYETGISYSGRTYADGKKINWRDGISALRCIIRYNLFR